ncbi:MAG: DegV family protein [Clostridia bacterium]|nr:DegV family protein [Clostridia bacterium]
MNYKLSCESTVDLPWSYVNGRGLPVLFYTYSVDGREYTDDMGRDPEALPGFYKLLAEGHLPKTSQLNFEQYIEFFEPLVKNGDLLHIAFGSGMTASVNNAFLAAEELRRRYPGRRIEVVDSLCSSSGYGLLVDYAADMREAGASMDEVINWLNANRRCVHHQFFSTDLKFFKRSGRVSGAAATIGSILGICPIMRLDDAGRIIAYDKVRGKKNAIQTTLDTMEAHVRNGREYSGKCFICNSDCPDIAEQTRAAVRQRFPKIQGEIRMCDIGTIIASHSGPGTVAVFFLGDERLPDAHK